MKRSLNLSHICHPMIFTLTLIPGREEMLSTRSWPKKPLTPAGYFTSPNTVCCDSVHHNQIPWPNNWANWIRPVTFHTPPKRCPAEAQLQHENSKPCAFQSRAHQKSSTWFHNHTLTCFRTPLPHILVSPHLEYISPAGSPYLSRGICSDLQALLQDQSLVFRTWATTSSWLECSCPIQTARRRRTRWKRDNHQSATLN